MSRNARQPLRHLIVAFLIAALVVVLFNTLSRVLSSANDPETTATIRAPK